MPIQKKIIYNLKTYSRSKSIKIKIQRSGEVIVTAPTCLFKKRIDAFVQSHAQKISDYQEQISSLPQPNIKKTNFNYKKSKIQARDKIKSVLEKINTYYKYQYNLVFIRNQKTRWGSCSNKRNLNFNYKIFFLPEDLMEYVITHELCHLKQMNHSPRFWKLVEETIPDYKSKHNKLKKFRL